MTTHTDISRVSNTIRASALKVMESLLKYDTAYNIAKRRAICPIDYMRYAEFEAILRDLEIKPQMAILDVSSPQWFSLYLAQEHPETTFHYINIIDSELNPYMKISSVLGIRNLNYHKGDVRELQFNEDTFDMAVSISVIEHVFPEEGGDLKALQEIKRVLKLQGELLLTIPYKSKRNIVYVDGPVYERGERRKNFFAREYDKEMFEKLIEDSGFSVRSSWFICERQGLFSPDYYEWGPGKGLWLIRYLMKSRRLVELLFGKSLDAALARHYLSVCREIRDRVVNLSAVLVDSRRSTQ